MRATERQNRKTEIRSDIGCYLVYTDNCEGEIHIHWSKTDIPEAFGKFVPGSGVKIPGFKLKHNHGKQELLRNIQGKNSAKRVYECIAQFLKIAQEHKSVQVHMRPGPISYSTYVLNEGFVANMTIGASFSMIGVSAVAVMGADHQGFLGVKCLSQGLFCDAGNNYGFALALRK